MSKDADNKVFNMAKLFSSHADKFGYRIGEKLPDILENLLNGFVKRGQIGRDFEELVPGAHVLISKGVEFLANVLELPKERIKKLVPGFLGDVLHETINEAIDAMGRGAGEAPKDGKKPTEEKSKPADAAKAVDPKTEAPASNPQGLLYAYLKRFNNENPLAFMEIVDGVLRPMIASDHDLKVKFYTAFKSLGSYDDFVFLLNSPNEHWHAMLDELIGEPKRDNSTLELERQQFAEALDGFCEHLVSVAKWAGGRDADGKLLQSSVRGKIAAYRRSYKDEWEAIDKRRARKSNIVSWVVIIVVFSSIAYLALNALNLPN